MQGEVRGSSRFGNPCPLFMLSASSVTAGQRVAGGRMGASVCFQTGFSPLFPQKKKRNFEKLYFWKKKKCLFWEESRGEIMTSDTLALRVCLYDVNWRRSKGNRKRQTSKVKKIGQRQTPCLFSSQFNEQLLAGLIVGQSGRRNNKRNFHPFSA